MAKRKGIPADTLFRKTEAQDEPADENISQSKQRDTKEKAKTTATPRQTYYVPEELHTRLKILAIQRKVNVSDLVVEGIEQVLKGYGG